MCQEQAAQIQIDPASDHTTQQQVGQRRELVLLLSVKYLDLDTLLALVVLSKETHKQCVTRDSVGYWAALCGAFAVAKGLYMPAAETVSNPRKFFFEELWVARHKWALASDAAEDDANNNNNNNNPARFTEFKIRVGCRFRPGARGQGNMCLPLHQFLRVKREAKAAAAAAAAAKDQDEGNSTVLIGESDPAEFLDPFLGSLMREPVLLESSGQVCDRALAVQCILRGGKDPFNGQKLTRDMLVPQPDLAARIDAWRQKKAAVDVSVGVGEVKSLIADSAVDPELLEALLEAERLDHTAKRAQIDAASATARGGCAGREGLGSGGGEDGAAPATEADDEPQHPSQQHDADVTALAADVDGLGGPGAGGRRTLGDGPDGGSGGGKFSKNGDVARVIDVNESRGCVSMHVPGNGVRPFFFNHAYEGHASQQAVYATCAADSVVASLNGFNACVLCYGQTGSGKTHTSFGPEGALDADIPTPDAIPATAGIVVRACAQLLVARDALAKRGVYVALSVQFVEVYDEQVTDLLTGRPVSVRRESGDLVGATEEALEDMPAVMAALRRGHERKRFAATAMNDRSSRSHTAFIVQVTQTCAAAGAGDSAGQLVKTQLHLIDLAGSERVKKSQATGVRMKEAVGINSSLLVLGKVIAALVESHHHVPYLESKLTTMLRGAFGGNSRTTAVVACRSDDAHGDETLQSLRFGERCGMISNSTKTAATSLGAALQTIDTALVRVRDQVASLERRGKTHLESYHKLAASLSSLERKRNDLAKTAPPPPPMAAATH